MQDKPSTPEKDLLKLIEDQGKEKGTSGTYAIHTGLSLFSLSAWIGRFSFFKKKLSKKWKGSDQPYLFDLKKINILLFFIIIILGAYFINNLSYSLSTYHQIPQLAPKSEGEARPASFKEDSLLKKTAAYYFEKIAQRDIFKMGPKPAITEEKKTVSPVVKEATKNLRLVGISWSDNPDAMIEDTQAKRTFFVKRGQSVGKMKIQAIFKDRVILSYEGEEIELK